jgi:DNA-binding response OmpR family regulator
VIEAVDGQAGLDLALSEKPALVILDVGLPTLDGFEVCRQLRLLEVDTPILMLTSRSQLSDRVRGLNSGADDYLAKPFEVSELLARINALLRRHRRVKDEILVLELGDIHIDLEKKSATQAGRSLSLTKTDYALLGLLARNAGQPVSREKMLDVVWGYTRFPTTRAVDTHIWRLRKKLGDAGEDPRWIKRVQGQGYALAVAA